MSVPRPITRGRFKALAVLIALTVLLIGLLTTTTGPAYAAAPKPPGGLTSTAKTVTTVSLKWSAVTKAPRYRVKWSTSSSFTKPKYKELTGTSTTITGLSAKKLYYIKVRVVAKNGDGITAYSKPIKVTTDATRTGPLRVGSYNVRCDTCFLPGTEEARWTDRRDSVAAAIKAQNLDVIGVQEASQGWLFDSSGKKYSLSQFEDLTARVGAPYKLVNSKRNNCVKDTTPTKCEYKDQGASLGTRILYNSTRIEIINSGSKLLPETNTADTRHYVAWAEFRQLSTGKKFIFGNSHLTAYAENHELRKVQTEVALATIAANNPKKLPVISVGDWNSGRFDVPTNAPYDVYVAAGFVDPLGGAYRTTTIVTGATVEKRINTWLNSFNGFKRAANGHPTWVNGTYIDYIMTTPMRVSEWETVAKLDAYGNFVGQIPSDHNMIRATVWLPA
ncbi:MAG TPA: endonuclease/exonuclease/phosphatase family protein [Propionibacteriaceae bacterium]